MYHICCNYRTLASHCNKVGKNDLWPGGQGRRGGGRGEGRGGEGADLKGIQVAMAFHK